MTRTFGTVIMDVVLPTGGFASMCVKEDLMGSDVLNLARRRCSGQSFAVCQKSLAPGKEFDVLYVEGEGEQYLSEFIVNRGGPFAERSVQSMFVHDRNMASLHRVCLFIFTSEKLRLLLDNQKLTLDHKEFVNRRRVAILVRIGAGVIVKEMVKRKQDVGSIVGSLYKKLSSMYGSTAVASMEKYQFGLIEGEWFSSSTKFCDEPKLVAALRKQVLNPDMPLFRMIVPPYRSERFQRAMDQCTRDLDLPLMDYQESYALHMSLEKTRIRLDNDRRYTLTADPLRARMRVSGVDPPLGAEAKRKPVILKVNTTEFEIENLMGTTVKVGQDQTVNQAIRELLEKIVGKGEKRTDVSATPLPVTLSDVGGSNPPQHMSGRRWTVNTRGRGGPEKVVNVEKDQPGVFAFTLKGTDDVLAGEIPMSHFVCVRQHLASSNMMMEVVLHTREELLNESVMETGGGGGDDKEVEREDLSKRLLTSTPPHTSWRSMPFYPHSRSNGKLCVFVRTVWGIPKDKKGMIWMSVALVSGSTIIASPVKTRAVPAATNVLINEYITIDCPSNEIPRTARLSFTVYRSKWGTKVNVTPVSTYNLTIFDCNGWINTGEFECRMWKDRDTDLLLPCCESNEENAPRVKFTIPQCRFRMAFFRAVKSDRTVPEMDVPITDEEERRIRQLINEFYQDVPTEKDREMLWKHRMKREGWPPELLPLILSAIDYRKTDQLHAIPSILSHWKPFPPTIALRLLDVRYADTNIRAFCVECLGKFNDNEFMLYLLQIVQGLRYELYDDNPLARFIVARGWREPKFVGHQVFWQLMSEVHVSQFRRRFCSLIVNFFDGMKNIGGDDLVKAYKFTQELVALNMELPKKANEATIRLREKLSSVSIPNKFRLPMNPCMLVESFVIDECRVMKSKKRPFLLTFKNASETATEHVQMIFKVGDDLRQDQLTLQLMRVMEHLWREAGHEFHMSCYGVLPTGLNQGFVEVVPRATTEADLQVEKGAVRGVWSTSIFENFLLEYNSGVESYKRATRIFARSSAGYAIATSTLGIADRHPGNIMVQQDGHFFHIDFGHFLGNWKKKLGFQRESRLFHFSTAAAQVVGDMDEFKSDCWNALTVLRKNVGLLIALLLLMLGTGIPELSKAEDVDYLKKQLIPNPPVSEEEDRAALATLIEKSAESARTAFNNWCHNVMAK